MLQVDSVVDLAYEQIRRLVLDGDIAPGERLGQVELAERLGISRTPVREALRRLSAEGLVELRPNRGFWAADLGLDAVLRRLEVRLILEPGIARLAAERRTDRHLAELTRAITREEKARSGVAAHDASREFHFVLARATGNDEHVRILDSLWLVEVGRRLLARRATTTDWQGADVSEHRAIAAAVSDRDGDLAARLMDAHVRAAFQHWEEKQR
ncbi:GntR family transcriptional regulator [Solirubrobacter soli]|uniref:GntR family transcriptional regulator n=1 Tax=Solirubrobacter soli TaxID=363832 RepID=UPI00040BB654|nr:GntR family transcriptional regulator [Solirubrobacter soli]